MPKPAARAPNVLWYCSDQQRFDTIGALGNPHVHTPTLDRLVAEGVAFTHAYCQSPICTPSRASFLTGKYPSTIHANANGLPYFPPHERLVTRRLADTGYDCGLVGKLHLAGAYYGREPRVDDGYRYFQYSHAPRDDWRTGHDYADWLRARGEDPARVLRPRPRQYGDLMEPSPELDNVPPQLHQTTWCTDMAIEFITAARDGPWLLSVNPYHPHPPFNPPWEYYRRFDPATMPGPHFRESDLAHQARLAAFDFQSRPRRPEEYEAKKIQAAYYAMIEQVDHELGRILAALEQTGQREHTVVIFTSDHGEALGDHGLVHKGCRFFDGLVRVPLLWSWPGASPLGTGAGEGPKGREPAREPPTTGRWRAGLRSEALVELTDIAPTLLELAGLPIPEGMQGRSLLPILTGRTAPDHHRDFVRCEFFRALGWRSRSFATMYRDRRYKLVAYHGDGTGDGAGHNAGELYDLERDPYEFDSLWQDPAHQALKVALLQRSFDATVQALDYGPSAIMPM